CCTIDRRSPLWPARCRGLPAPGGRSARNGDLALPDRGDRTGRFLPQYGGRPQHPGLPHARRPSLECRHGLQTHASPGGSRSKDSLGKRMGITPKAGRSRLLELLSNWPVLAPIASRYAEEYIDSLPFVEVACRSNVSWKSPWNRSIRLWPQNVAALTV